LPLVRDWSVFLTVVDIVWQFLRCVIHFKLKVDPARLSAQPRAVLAEFSGADGVDGIQYVLKTDCHCGFVGSRGRLQSIASATALPHVTVSALPPRSRVRSVFSASTRSIASTMARPASFSPRCSSIMAPDQIWPIGLAMPWPAMSGAEPCTGSNTDRSLPSGWM